MASAAANFGGSFGGHYVLHLDVNEIAVDAANNRSLISITCYFYFDQSSFWTYNLNTTSGTVFGQGRSIGGYDFRGGGASNNYFLMNNEQYWIGHNPDGTGSVSVSASYNADNSPYLTTASTGLTLGLTTINRYANVTSFTQSTTDASITLNASTDTSASSIQFSIDGGSTYVTAGSGTSASMTFANVKSNQSYTCYVRTVSAVSGLTTGAGPITATTTPQNNFLGFL